MEHKYNDFTKVFCSITRTIISYSTSPKIIQDVSKIENQCIEDPESMYRIFIHTIYANDDYRDVIQNENVIFFEKNRSDLFKNVSEVNEEGLVKILKITKLLLKVCTKIIATENE